jgi:hypothetical protein
MTDYALAQIARVCHEANRALQLANGEEPSPHWDDAPSWQQGSAMTGVCSALAGATPEQQHERWLEDKRAHAWTWGPAKDGDARTHPCMVPYAALPPGQRAKDHLFVAIVAALCDTAAGTRTASRRRRACGPPQTPPPEGEHDMSFSFSAAGLPSEVAAQLRSLHVNDGLGSAMRDVITGAMDDAADQPHIRYVVRAAGHAADASTTSLTASIEAVYCPVITEPAPGAGDEAEAAGVTAESPAGGEEDAAGGDAGPGAAG